MPLCHRELSQLVLAEKGAVAPGKYAGDVATISTPRELSESPNPFEFGIIKLSPKFTHAG